MKASARASAIAAATAAAAMFATPVASAVERSPFEDRFRLTMGAWSASTETTLRADANDGSPGTLLSAEGDFGMRERSEMADVEVELRLRPRHKLRLNFFQLDRQATTVLTRQLEFGEQTYLVDDVTDSQLDIGNFSVSYSYMFVRRDRFELGASFGLHLYEFNGRVAVPARLIEEEESEAGPVPLVGLEGAVRFNSRWHAEARMEYLGFSADRGDVRVRFTNLRAGVFYRFNDNMSAGLGYVMLDSNVRLKDPGNSGRWEFSNRGGELLFRVGF